jgi:predicted nucleic acid-binding protein
MRLFNTSILLEKLKRREYDGVFISVVTLIETLRGVPEEKRNRVKELSARKMKHRNSKHYRSCFSCQVQDE